MVARRLLRRRQNPAYDGPTPPWILGQSVSHRRHQGCFLVPPSGSLVSSSDLESFDRLPRPFRAPLSCTPSRPRSLSASAQGHFHQLTQRLWKREMVRLEEHMNDTATKKVYK